jgi:hypothetical protein
MLCFFVIHYPLEPLMPTLKRLFLITVLLNASTTIAQECGNCCDRLGGISYCDSSAGRYVCKNGDYSSCYCTIHAVMDLQKLQGCCLWQGGVFKIDELGLVICNNGSISELCSLQKSN